MNDTKYQIGCDIGGTFIDVAVIDSHGNVISDKSDTTPDDLTQGVVVVLQKAAAQIGISLGELLANTTRFVNGTTVVTNSIAELRGSRVGLVTTRGFGDTLRIARGPRTSQRDFRLQRNVPDLVPRECIKEVTERVDRFGKVVVPIDAAEVVRVVDSLVDLGCESIAVSFLWSFMHPAHEEIVAKVAHERHPNLYVSLSSRLAPVMREYERTVTAVLNSFTGLRVVEYVDRIEALLHEHGLTVPISFMQGFGGTLSGSEARERPISLVDSGPAGGVIGVQALGRQLAIDHVLAADMGGTSFDVAVLPGCELTVTPRVMLREFLTAVPKLDVLAVGAGGGSIGRIDARGVPQVGPQSAGADPGPACYGRGGDQPTVTDAVVALGLIDPETFLGGTRRLDRGAAERALAGAGIDGDATAVAAAMYRLVCASMAEAVRRQTVERGQDPRRFTMCSYGGAFGVFAGDICRTVGVGRIVIPREAGVFSAYGLLSTDDVRTATRSVHWEGGDASAVRTALTDLEADARASLISSGYSAERIQVLWQGDFRYAGQLFELTVPIDRGRGIDEALAAVQADFDAIYENEFGPNTAWAGSPVMLLSVRVVATGTTDKLAPTLAPTAASDSPAAAQLGQREVLLPSVGGTVTASIFDGSRLAPGMVIAGPAVIEHRLTTVVVPPDWRLEVDGYGNQIMTDHLVHDGGAESRQAVAASI